MQLRIRTVEIYSRMDRTQMRGNTGADRRGNLVKPRGVTKGVRKNRVFEYLTAVERSNISKYNEIKSLRQSSPRAPQEALPDSVSDARGGLIGDCLWDRWGHRYLP